MLTWHSSNIIKLLGIAQFRSTQKSIGHDQQSHMIPTEVGDGETFEKSNLTLIGMHLEFQIVPHRHVCFSLQKGQANSTIAHVCMYSKLIYSPFENNPEFVYYDRTLVKTTQTELGSNMKFVIHVGKGKGWLWLQVMEFGLGMG